MIDSTSINGMFDANVFDADGDKIGTVKQVFVDQDDQQPLFVSVATGLFGTSESFVPLRDASFDGDSLRVAYDKATVKDAPRIDADGALSDGEHDRLWDYYHGKTGNEHDRTAADDAQAPGGSQVPGSDEDAVARREAHRNRSENDVSRSRVRLRKYVITEQQTITIPVRHEEIRVERVPTADSLGAETGSERSGVSETSAHEETGTDDRNEAPGRNR